MIWQTMSFVDAALLFFLMSKDRVGYQENLNHPADKLYGDAHLIFQQDLASACTVKGTITIFNDHGITVAQQSGLTQQSR